ncbi:hypothetical protein HMPREF9588_01871 [Cutibacterium acnes HL025PA2]|nr:hypothetical protein HMPREF9588_01871 [Cutibacterium acnes HL025PA2]
MSSRHRPLHSISLSPTALHDNEVSVSATSDVAASRTSTSGSRWGLCRHGVTRIFA